MKEKRFIVEMYISDEKKVYYIVRGLPKLPNQPSEFVVSFDSAEELGQFFSFEETADDLSQFFVNSEND